MIKTKTGIEMPEATDKFISFGKALGTLWRICRDIGDVLDEQQDEINKLKERIDALGTEIKKG